MSSMPLLAMAHPVLLICGIVLAVIVVVGIVIVLPDVIRYIKITWM